MTACNVYREESIDICCTAVGYQLQALLLDVSVILQCFSASVCVICSAHNNCDGMLWLFQDTKAKCLGWQSCPTTYC